MATTIYADRNRQPVGHWEDAMGNHLYSRPLMPDELDRWMRDRADDDDDNDGERVVGGSVTVGGSKVAVGGGIYQSKELQSASTGIDHVQLWTTQEADYAPSIAYLVGPNLTTSAPMLCLRISIKVKREDLNQKGMAVGKPVVKLEIGYCPQSLIAGCPVKITAKQTARQKWLATIWKKVQFHLEKKSMAAPDEGAFTLIETLSTDAIVKQDTVRLIMMMYSEFWERGEYSDESKMSEIDAFGIANPTTRSAFGSKFRRMEFKISCKG